MDELTMPVVDPLSAEAGWICTLVAVKAPPVVAELVMVTPLTVFALLVPMRLVLAPT